MTIKDDAPTAADGSARPGATAWTLADFLSTYRYWALFLSGFLVALGGQGAGLVLPVALMEAAASQRDIGILHSCIGAGWLLGAFLSFVIAPRHGRSALVWPVLAFAATDILVMTLPGSWSSDAALVVFGLACGAAQGVFPLALAVFLLGGRPSRVEFAAALLLLSTTVLAGGVAPILAFQLWADGGAFVVLAAVTGCMLAAVALLVPARGLGFADAPPRRHAPLAPRRRSPVAVAAILLTPPILLGLLGLGLHLAEPFEAEDSAAIAMVLALAVLGVALAALVYLGVWLYRIHGELAGAAPSQRLVTPLAAVLVAFLVPFGLPVLLLTLGDLLNDRARRAGNQRAVSIAWLTVWTLVLPPIALAMIQQAANDSYAEIPAAGAGL